MNLRSLRKEKGLTQAEVAQRLGISQSAVAAYKRGAKKPEMDRMHVIAEALGVGVEELYGTKAARKPAAVKTHKNKRVARVQELFEKLPENEQRVLLKQIRLLAQKG